MLYTGIALAAVSGGYFYMRRNGESPIAEAKKLATPAKPAFTGGDQGFLSLQLEKSEIINHNTKKLTFSLPEADMESGLTVACTLRCETPELSNKTLIYRSRRHHEVQGPRDAEASHSPIHPY